MLKSKSARIGFLIATTGIAVLGYSLISWTQNSNRIVYVERQYEWVPEDGRKFSEAVGRDQEWRLSSTCLHNFVVAKLARAKVDLEDHERALPQEIREWLAADPTRSVELIPKDNPTRYMFNPTGNNSEFRALTDLQAKYRDWFNKRPQLNFAISSWERELKNVATRYFRESQLSVFSTGSLDSKLKVQFQLFAFSDAEAKQIIETCATKTPIVRVAVQTNLKSDLGYWPLDRPFTFYAGLILFLLGLAYHPVTRWVRSGE